MVQTVIMSAMLPSDSSRGEDANVRDSTFGTRQLVDGASRSEQDSGPALQLSRVHGTDIWITDTITDLGLSIEPPSHRTTRVPSAAILNKQPETERRPSIRSISSTRRRRGVKQAGYNRRDVPGSPALAIVSTKGEQRCSCPGHAVHLFNGIHFAQI